MSDSDRQRILGEALEAYSESKKSLSLLRNEFQQLGKMLQEIGQSLQDPASIKRALHLISNNPMKRIDAQQLRQALVEFEETEARLLASLKNLQSMGIAIE